MTSSGTAKVILFDLFGVLTEAQPTAGKEELLAAAGIVGTADGEAFWTAYWHRRPAYDRSTVSAQEYWQSVGADLGTTFPPDMIAALIDADCGSWRRMNPAMVALLERLTAAGQTIALLSNIPEVLAADLLRRHECFDLFAATGFSCRIGAAKPDPAAFHWCLAQLGVDAPDVLFIDDRAENVAAAEALGMRAKVFVGAADLVRYLDLAADPVVVPSAVR